jgi:hypothetical protein
VHILFIGCSPLFIDGANIRAALGPENFKLQLPPGFNLIAGEGNLAIVLR